MTTTPRQTTSTVRPTDQHRSVALANASLTFDPFNTADCPRMFSDKWQAGD